MSSSRLTTAEDIETARDLARMAGFRDPNAIVKPAPLLARQAAWRSFLDYAKKINDNFTSFISSR